MSPLAFGVGSSRAFGVGRATAAPAPPASLVTSGLLLYLDAGIASSYPGSGTSWYDISGSGRVGSFAGGPTYSSADGGSIVFNGSNYIIVSGSNTLTAATFSVWLRRNGTQVDFTGLLHGRGTNPTGMIFAYNYGTVGYMWNDTQYYYNSGLTPPNGAWCMCVVTVTSTEAKVYLGTSSGIATATNTTAHASTTISSLAVAADTVGYSRNVVGNISQALLYNRAITAAEVTQNFNALRSRYGI